MSIRTTVFSLIAASLAVTGIASADAKAPAARVEIAITPKGFSPDHITIKKDQATVLAFTRKTDATCAKAIVVDLGGGKKVTKDLPLGQTVEISATFTKSGDLSYACGMDMLHGVMTVE
jgi:plastocyanin domain-containing protein